METGNWEDGRRLYSFCGAFTCSVTAGWILTSFFPDKVFGIREILVVFLCSLVFFFFRESRKKKIWYLAGGCGSVLILAALTIGNHFFPVFELLWKVRRGGLMFLLIVVIALAGSMTAGKFLPQSIYTVGMTGALLYQGSQGKKAGVLVMAAAVYYILDAYLRWSQRIQKRSEVGADKVYFMAPVIVLATILSLLLPIKEEPLKWEFAVNIYHKVEGIKEDISFALYSLTSEMPDAFGVRSAGYDEDGGEIDGFVFGKEHKMLTISTTDRIQNSLYLTGTIRDYYDGGRFETSREAGKSELAIPESELDQMEKLFCLADAGLLDKSRRTLFHNNRITITYSGLRTRSILYPSGCFFVERSTPDYERTVEGENILFAKKAKKETEYTCGFLEINYGNEEIQSLLRSLSKVNEEEFLDNAGNSWFQADLEEYLAGSYEDQLMGNVRNEDLASMLSTRQKRIETLYLQGVAELPERVRVLSQELTMDKTSDYDKAMAIKTYLETFQYSTDMESTPGNEDVVDYFLFEQKKGYCTYFAASMTMLCRSAGIPARYVEGVYLRSTNGRGESQEVNNSSTHAWAEVYLQGYGWVCMDATPGYGAKKVILWPEQDITASAVSGGSGEAYLPSDAGMVNDSSLLGADGLNQTKKGSKIPTGVWYGILLLIGLLLTVFLLYLGKARREYKRADSNGKVRMLMEEILISTSYLLASEGSENVRGEIWDLGLHDYISQLFELSIFSEEEQNSMQLEQMEAVFESIRYSGKKNPSDELWRFVIVRDMLKEKAVGIKGGMKYAWYVKTHKIS